MHWKINRSTKVAKKNYQWQSSFSIIKYGPNKIIIQFFLFFGGGGGCKWNWIIYGLKTVRKFSTKSIVKTTRYPKEPDRTCVPTEKILINALVAGKPLCKASIAVIVITGSRENLIIGENIVPSCHLVFVSSPEREGESPEPTGDQYNQSASEYIISRRKGALRTLFGESQ